MENITLMRKTKWLSFIIVPILFGLLCMVPNPVFSQVVLPDFINSEPYPGAVSSVTVTMPAGSAIGDLVMVNIVTDDDGAITSPVEFTELAEFFTGTAGPTTGLYYRVIDGTEAASYVFSFPAEPAVVTTIRYNNSDVVSSSPFDGVAVTSSGVSANPQAPSITTTANNKTILQFVGVDGASAGVLASNTPTNTVLAANQSGESAGAEMMLTYSYQELAGATPIGNYTFASEQWATITVALNTRPKVVNLTGTTGTSCAGSSSISATYEVPNTSGNFELLDPLGNVVASQPYTGSSGSVTISFTATLSGSYTLRNQTFNDVQLSADFFIDSDGDSVCDDIDLDDDNDGLTDMEEDAVCFAVDYNDLANKQQIQISSNTGLGGGGGIGVLLDGNTTDQNFWYTNSGWTGDEIVRLEFPSPTVLSGLEFWIGNSRMMDNGTVLRAQGSNDGSTWEEMSPVAEYVQSGPNNTPGVLSAAPFSHTFLWENAAFYKFYRLLGISGGGNPTPYVYELFFRTESFATCDFDGDGRRNSLDLDSDGDGIPDNVEAQTTAGYVAPNADSQGTYAGNGGINSAYLGGLPQTDTNTDGNPDFLDTESDDDRIPDLEESGLMLTGIIGANGLDMGVYTSDDYSDVNGIVDDPNTDLAKVTTLTTEVDYRDKQPPPQITLCYNSNGGPSFGGSNMSNHDDKLLNPANFGEFGLAYYDFILKDIGDGANLNSSILIAEGCQIFFMGGSTSTFDPAPHIFTASGLEDLKAWGASPNNVIITFQNHSTAIGGFETVGGTPVYNFDGANGNRNPNSLTMLGEEVVSGPFGQTTQFNQGGSFQGHYTLFPSYACAVAVDNTSPDPRPTILLNGETGDFYIADWGILGSTGGVTNSPNITSNNDILYANMMNSAARVVIEGPTDVCSFFLCPAGEEAPSLTSTSVSSAGLPIDLNPLYTGTPPAATTLTWHTMSPPADDNYIGNSDNYRESGVVFAAFRADDGSCYSPPTPVMVSVNYPDLEVTITPGTEASAQGEVQTFTVMVTNNGPITAPDAEVKIPIPNSRELILANPSAGSYSGSDGVWSVGQLTNGQSATLNITIRLQ